MPAPQAGIAIRIRALNPQQQPLGGTVDVACKPQRTGETVAVKAADASKDIDGAGLERTPPALSQVMVTLAGIYKPASQSVTSRPKDFSTKGPTSPAAHSIHSKAISSSTTECPPQASRASTA